MTAPPIVDVGLTIQSVCGASPTVPARPPSTLKFSHMLFLTSSPSPFSVCGSSSAIVASPRQTLRLVDIGLMACPTRAAFALVTMTTKPYHQGNLGLEQLAGHTVHPGRWECERLSVRECRIEQVLRHQIETTSKTSVIEERGGKKYASHHGTFFSYGCIYCVLFCSLYSFMIIACYTTIGVFTDVMAADR